MKIETTVEIGLCFGVKRAVSILEKAAREHGGMETLGPVAHNRQVMQRLAQIGISVANSIDDIQGGAVAISSHGVSPQMEQEIRNRHINAISTTCPFVLRAQVAARRLAKDGFWVVVYGDAGHPEVKGIIGCANGAGLATLDSSFLAGFDRVPRRLGIVSQTTQVPAHFSEFVKRVIDYALVRDSELCVIDTICHDTRKRQVAAVDLAHRVDFMLVIGSDASANTNRLVELCSAVCETHLIETAEGIQPSWFQGRHHVGVTSGASTPEWVIDEAIARLEAMA